MKKRILYIATLCFTILFGSCVKDLDTFPLDKQVQTADQVYSKEENYIKGLMKIYSMYAMSGQDGAGSSDIEGMDGGNTQLYRSWWTTQVGPTDEAINSWPNSWVPEINEMKWTASQNEAIEGLYQRCMYLVAISNEYLKQTTDEMMSKRGIKDSFKPTVHGFRNEARALRALSYYMLMDSFGRPPFITEDNYSKAPSQISREELFNWIEKELLDLKTTLPNAGTAYGRTDQAFANALLARMYLNAEVYTGTARYTDCITACNAVLSAGYSIAPDYANMFRADNNQTSASEIIFPIVYEGAATQTYGGIAFLIASSRGSDDVSVAKDGVKGGWSGNRARAELVKKFEFTNPNYGDDQDAASIKDKRGIFYAVDKTLEIKDWLKTFESEGWSVHKFSNLRSDGTPGSNPDFPDTDIPVFRLAEIYLTYAEAVKRGGAGGTEAQAVNYVNELRQRGYGDNSGDITASNMTLDFLLDERAREMYWEATRRTDLVRYGYFTSSAYVWSFKGGVANGTSVESYRNIFPIPSSDMTANGSLTQNAGYN